MPDIATVAQGALDQFIVDLVEAGFETKAGRVWTGPVDPSLAGLTTATTMKILIHDGWPFRHPSVLVEGLKPSVHLNEGYLCLWRVGDDSFAWLRLADLRDRIAQWAERYRGAATLEDPILDPHLYWRPIATDVMATIDLSKVRWGDGGSGDLRATLKDEVLEIGSAGDLPVRWYGRERMRHPPVSMEMITDGIKAEQARNLQRELENVGRPGGMGYLLLIWDTPVGEPNILALRLTRDEDGLVKGESIEIARIDEDVLIRRAGPDAPTLRSKSIVIFGQGAIGSHLAEILGRSGVGAVKGVDGQRLRPGDVVRHAALEFNVGASKVVGTQMATIIAAPWTKYRPIDSSTWDPDVLAKTAEGADLVIDAVGEATFTEQLSRLLVGQAAPLVSIALYRGGAVSRARVWSAGGTPIHERSASFPIIPPDPLPPAAVWETGCASPVNNAPPTSVYSAAALAARVAIEVLTGREAGNFDAIEVYRPIEAAGFDQVGYSRHDG